VKITVLCDLMPCNHIKTFKGAYRLLLVTGNLFVYPDDSSGYPEMSVHIYPCARRHVPEEVYLQILYMTSYLLQFSLHF
jgi:hypothetical protein